MLYNSPEQSDFEENEEDNTQQSVIEQVLFKIFYFRNNNLNQEFIEKGKKIVHEVFQLIHLYLLNLKRKI